MTKKLKLIALRFIAVTLALVMASSSASAFAKSENFTDIEHSATDFNTIKYERPLLSTTKELAEKLIKAASIGNNEAAVRAAYVELFEEYMNVSDMYILNSLNVDKEPDNETYLAEADYLAKTSPEVDGEFMKAFIAAYEAGYKLTLKDVSGVYYDSLCDSIEAYKQPDIVEINQKIEELCNTYNMLANSSDDIVSFEELYYDLVTQYNRLAKCYGYKNYTEYAYHNYNRDMTPEEVLALCDNFKEYSDFFYNLSYCYSNGHFNNEFTSAFSPEEVENIVRDNLSNVSRDFTESFEYLEKYNLMQAVNSSGVTSYVNSLPRRKIPFIAINDQYKPQTASYNDTLIHEFGHFNNAYWYPDLFATMSLDVAEIPSTAFEMMFPASGKYYGEYSERVLKAHVSQVLSPIFDSAAISAAEITAFSKEYKSPEKMVKAINKALEEYGVDENYFFGVPHIYSSPHYYISYGLASLASLEIFSIAVDDYDKGKEAYCNVIRNSGLAYSECLKKSGLTSKWTKEASDNLLTRIYDYLYEGEAPKYVGIEDGKVYVDNVSIEIIDDTYTRTALMAGDQMIYDGYKEYIDLSAKKNPIEIASADSFGNENSAKIYVVESPFVPQIEAKKGEQHITWKAIDGTTYYEVYGAEAGQKFKKLAKVKAGKKTSYVNKKVGSKSWKYYVKAVKEKKNGKTKVLDTSLVAIGATKSDKKNSNVKTFDITKNSLKLKKNKTKKLDYKLVKEDKGEKLISAKDVAGVRFYSSDKKIATVDENGVIKAKKVGECYIYAMTADGLWDEVVVTVRK